jgi:hypothetical protein
MIPTMNRMTAATISAAAVKRAMEFFLIWTPFA